MAPMMVGIDRAGRIVIPKEVRERLGIEPDDQLEVTVDDAGVRLTPVRARRRVIKGDDGLPVLDRVAGTTITDADVQRWRDADQR